MTLTQETEMSSSEIDDFLGSRETGVLTLARDDEPYSIPISYGYDASKRAFYMRLVSTPESEKREFLASSPKVRLVVYDENEDGTVYWSVVARGQLEELDPTSLSVEAIEQYGNTRRPLFEIWGESREELDIKLYEFSPDEMSGRRTEIDRQNE